MCVSRPIELVLSCFKNAKKTKGGWIVTCPCHDDKKQSLSISEAKNGVVLIYCHAGCLTEDILKTVGLEMKNLFPESISKKPSTNIIETYDYLDRNGQFLFQVCKTSDKQFPVRHKDKQGKWVWGLENKKLVIYNLPKIIKAIQQGKLICIVEGEKDVHRLEQEGFIATTNPLGSNKWRKEYNQYLKGANVIIFPDNDKPGKAHAELVKSQLKDISNSVYILELPNLKKGEDISDWLDKYGTSNKLDILINKLTSKTKKEEDNKPIEYTFQDLKNLIGPIEWTWKGWLPKGLLVIVASEPGTGKSALALQLAATMIKGLPWPDGTNYEGELGSILWCESEAAQAINLERAQSWDIPLDKIKLPLLESPLMDIQLDNQSHRQAVKRAAQQDNIRLIVIDSLRGCYRGDENTSDSIEIVMWLAQLARDTEKPILLTHHLRKKGHNDGDSVSLDRLRGSTALIQPARVIWAMDTPDLELPDHKRLSVIKSNISKFPSPLGFVINGHGPEFGKPPVNSKKETLFDQTKERLLAILQAGPKPAKEIFEIFEAEGISKDTIKRAKKSLKVTVTRKDEQWLWLLPNI